MQLFLLPFAGGNCYSYDFLIKKIDKKRLESFTLELPGRGKRIDEAFIVHLKEAIDDYLLQVKSLRDKKPYIIYGHSMGAILAYHVSHKMEVSSDGPTALIVSGSSGPEIECNTLSKPKISELTDLQLKKKLRKLGGISDQILENTDVFNFFKVSIQSDFAILDDELSYNHLFSRIHAPIHAIMGSQEKNLDKIENWCRLTHTSCTFRVLKGNHFFIHQHAQEIADILTKYRLNNRLNSRNNPSLEL